VEHRFNAELEVILRRIMDVHMQVGDDDEEVAVRQHGTPAFRDGRRKAIVRDDVDAVVILNEIIDNLHGISFQ
jgi:hypothetical protein